MVSCVVDSFQTRQNSSWSGRANEGNSSACKWYNCLIAGVTIHAYMYVYIYIHRYIYIYIYIRGCCILIFYWHFIFLLHIKPTGNALICIFTHVGVLLETNLLLTLYFSNGYTTRMELIYIYVYLYVYCIHIHMCMQMGQIRCKFTRDINWNSGLNTAFVRTFFVFISASIFV